MPWYGYALLTAITIAAVEFIQKKTVESEHSLEFATFFNLVKLIFFLIIFSGRMAWSISAMNLALAVLAGVLGTIGFWWVTKALRRMDFSTVMPVLSIEPALVAVLALLVLHETISGRQVVGLGLTLVGTYVLELRRHAEKSHEIFAPFRNILSDSGGRYAAGGMIFFAAASLIDRFTLQRVAVPTYFGYSIITGAILCAILLAARHRRPQLLLSGSRHLAWFILLAAALSLVSGLAQAKAVSLTAVGLVIAIKRSSTLLDVAVGGRLFHERHLLQKMLASIILLIGVYFIVQP